MPQILPIKDLRDTTQISKICHEKAEPIFITKNGYGDMVVMSIEAYEEKKFASEIYFKLKEAELEAKSTSKRYSHIMDSDSSNFCRFCYWNILDYSGLVLTRITSMLE